MANEQEMRTIGVIWSENLAYLRGARFGQAKMKFRVWFSASQMIGFW